MKLTIIATVICTVISISAKAEIYKCTINGKQTFSDIPCPLSKGEHDPIPKVGSKSRPATPSDEQAKQQVEKDFQSLGGPQLSCADWMKLPPTVATSYNGSVLQVKQFILQTLKDPDSLKDQSWGQLNRTCSGYNITVSYRAKNSFGAYVKSVQRFSLGRDGAVTSVDTIQ